MDFIQAPLFEDLDARDRIVAFGNSKELHEAVVMLEPFRGGQVYTATIRRAFARSIIKRYPRLTDKEILTALFKAAVGDFGPPETVHGIPTLFTFVKDYLFFRWKKEQEIGRQFWRIRRAEVFLADYERHSDHAHKAFIDYVVSFTFLPPEDDPGAESTDQAGSGTGT